MSEPDSPVQELADGPAPEPRADGASWIRPNSSRRRSRGWLAAAALAIYASGLVTPRPASLHDPFPDGLALLTDAAGDVSPGRQTYLDPIDAIERPVPTPRRPLTFLDIRRARMERDGMYLRLTLYLQGALPESPEAAALEGIAVSVSFLRARSAPGEPGPREIVYWASASPNDGKWRGEINEPDVIYESNRSAYDLHCRGREGTPCGYQLNSGEQPDGFVGEPKILASGRQIAVSLPLWVMPKLYHSAWWTASLQGSTTSRRSGATTQFSYSDRVPDQGEAFFPERAPEPAASR